ncbi:hypothetical protein BS47DRAFT_1358159 [Hydnum rufescens UP504]|uniref:Uncharacterized protein n=1 Tax=Hydnum rufescens UP504 TaxID=1448309 RepID=A0A9P6DYK4_9AGAM|nr:hypothetical protein BS47DRAFT_1358159 [Hydnum rufescens UP504]
MHYNWPKIEYLGGMYVFIIYLYEACAAPNWALFRSRKSGIEWTQPQDPEELEEDHTPAAAGVWSYSCAKREAKAALVVLLQHRLRFSPPTDLHNDDPNPDGRLEINAGRNPPNTPHTCAAPTR